MRTRGKVALGGGMASAAVVGWLVAAGVFATTATLVVTDPLAPPAQAEEDALTSFEGCSELLDWYVSHGLKDVGPYGWGGRFYAVDLDGRFAARGMDSAAPMAAESSTGSATGTNTQEQAVDEPDVAKTNGSLVVRIANDDRSVALIDVTGAEPRTVGKYRLPADGYGAELLLVGDRVLVTQGVYDHGPFHGGRGGPWIEDRIMPAYGGEGSVRVLDLDISDPSSPTLVRKDVYSGTLTSARQYGATVRLVTTTGRPQLDWVTPSKKVTEKEATQRNKALVRATTIEDWLPTVRGNGASTPLLDCEDVFHPQSWSGAETVAVSTYAMADPGQRNAVGITATGQVVYSSGDRLYVASTEMEFAPVRPVSDPGFAGPEPDSRIATGPPKVTTNLHSFKLDGTGTTYAGSGHVDGSLRDRWSLDEYDGRLRVAWTTSDQRGRTNNGITVLAERNGKLVPTGTVTGLGKNENIQSVRWFDDLAIMVTFRQIDPLYTIDLTDQDNPKQLGALKIPGFSGYLHPVGDHLLLGLGVDATTAGRSLGAQAAVFDISDLDKPVRVSKAGFGPNTALTAVDDPRGFTWLAGASTGVTPLADWTTGKPVLKSLEVSSSGQLRASTIAELNLDWQSRTLELPGGRIAVLDHERVRLITVG